MKTHSQLLALALVVCSSVSVAAPVIGTPVDLFAGQSAVTAIGHDRFDTSFVMDEAALSPLLGGQSFSVPLRAVGSSVTVQYVGTMAAHGGTLFLAGAGALFSTRDGLSAQAAALDFSSFIATIGTQITISNLAAHETLVFGLDAEAYAGGDGLGIAANGTQQVLAQAGGSVRALNVGANQWLLGFETFGAVDFADALMLVTGVSFDAPPTTPGGSVPAPGSLALVLAALALLGATGRRHGRACVALRACIPR